MQTMLVLPILIPLLTAVLCLLAWRHARLHRLLGMIGATILLAAATVLFLVVQRNGIQVVQAGSWPAPFGITLIADRLAAIMILAVGIIAFCGELYSLDFVDEPRQSAGYHPLLFFLLTGTCGAILTGDLFNLYVLVELMLIASFVLIVLGNERAQLEGAVKYVMMNMLGSFVLLLAVGLLYGLLGTLNMADAARKLQALDRPGLVNALAMLFLVAFGIKAAIFPLFFWLPASYHTPPIAVTAIFAGLLTKVGVYALIRVFTLLFIHDLTFTHTLLLVLGGFTMLTGVLGAIAQGEVRRLLSFHIISQIGYMLMGLGLFSASALAATIFFTVHIIITKTALFFAAGIAQRIAGSYDLHELGGLYRQRPLLAGLFLLPALSLAGIPPLSGFIGKLSLIQAGLGLEQYAIVAVALIVSLLTFYSMVKIWTEAFWKPLPAGEFPRTHQRLHLLMIPTMILAVLAIAMGVFAGPLFDAALLAGQDLANPAAYIHAVLGGPQ